MIAVVTKKKTGVRKKNVKVLKLNKETVKDLTGQDAKRVKGGALKTAQCVGNIIPKSIYCRS